MHHVFLRVHCDDRFAVNTGALWRKYPAVAMIGGCKYSAADRSIVFKWV